MAYSLVPLVTTGDLWTAANHNTYVRDNFAVTAPGVVTDAGDMVYANTSKSLGRVPFIADGALLEAKSNSISWLEKVAGSYYPLRTNITANGFSYNRSHYGNSLYYSSATPQSIPPSVDTAVTFDHQVISGLDNWNPADPTKITIPATWPTGKWYWLTGYLQWPGSGIINNYAHLLIRFRKNGTTLMGGTTGDPQGWLHAVAYHQSCAHVAQLEPGDYVEFMVWQYVNASTSYNIYAQAFSLMMMAG